MARKAGKTAAAAKEVAVAARALSECGIE